MFIIYSDYITYILIIKMYAKIDSIFKIDSISRNSDQRAAAQGQG